MDGTARRLEEPRVFLDRQMEAAELYSVAGGEVAVRSFRSPLKQSANEDAATLIPVGPESAILMVNDGLGGGESGGHAADLASKCMIAAVGGRKRGGGSLRTAILDALEEANRRVRALGGGAGTTVALVETHGAAIRSYHVGDSMILVAGSDGRLKWRTMPHSPVGYAVAAGLLSEREALNHQQLHVVSNILGSAEMRIEIGPELLLDPGDTLVVASDGLLDNLLLGELAVQIRNPSLTAAADTLAASALQRMIAPSQGNPSKPDDLTLLLYRPTPPDSDETLALQTADIVST